MLSLVQFEGAGFQGECGRLRAQWEAEFRAGALASRGRVL